MAQKTKLSQAMAYWNKLIEKYCQTCLSMWKKYSDQVKVKRQQCKNTQLPVKILPEQTQ